MRNFIIIFALALSLTAKSQSINSFVLNAGGQSVTQQSYSLSFSIGEPVVGIRSAQSQSLFQGLIQPQLEDIVMGSESLIDSDLKLYPNPCTDILNVHVPENFIISIMDIQSKTIVAPVSSLSLRNRSSDIGLSTDEPTKVIDLSGIAAGMYIVSISVQNRIYRYTIFKQ